MLSLFRTTLFTSLLLLSSKILKQILLLYLKSNRSAAHMFHVTLTHRCVLHRCRKTDSNMPKHFKVS